MDKILNKEKFSSNDITEILKISSNEKNNLKLTKSEQNELFTKLIFVLNSKDYDIDVKIECVRSLSNFALNKLFRDVLFDNLANITEIVDEVLKKMKENGKVGVFHEYIFILLCRVLDYKFSASDLLELLDSDCEMSFALIERVLTACTYEDEIIYNMLHIFYGLTRPDTYMNNTDDPIEIIGQIIKYQELMNLLNFV